MINWNAVRSSGIKFVSIKASEGVTYTDPDFYANWIGAHAAGLTRTAYHFAHPSISAIDQANYFVAAVTSAGGYAHNTSTMQLMLDLESTDGLEPPAVWSWVQAFMGHLQNLTGRPGIIYTVRGKPLKVACFHTALVLTHAHTHTHFSSHTKTLGILFLER